MLEGENLSQLAQLAPLATSLVPALPGELFTEDQWASFLAICEVFIPSVPKATEQRTKYQAAKTEIQRYLPSNVSEDVVDKFLAESFDQNELKESLRRRISLYIPKSQIEGLSFILSALNTRLGSYIITGSTSPIQSQSLETRTEIVCKWSDAYLKPLRAVFNSMQTLSKLSWIGQSEMLHDVTGFPIVGDHMERAEGYKFDFINFESHPTGRTIELDYDIVIIGSGCGAGVMASHLGRAAAGMQDGKKPKILVIEKGYHFPSTHFPMSTSAASDNLMEGGGGVQSSDGSIAILAGATWGGGGTVNWSASLQPQSFVREEWADKDGLDLFTSREFQDCLDTVCDKMGVCKMTDEAGKAQIPQNFGNEKLLEGARRLGVSVEVVPQNSGSKPHRCGHCSEGCASATKQGPANCWLPDAAQNGVEFVEGCFVEEILWDDTSGRKKARGIKAEWTARDRSTKRNIIIYSKRVIVSAGTLQSPALLIRSGITNRQVGANLHLHPTMCIGIVWPERVDPWEGPILTAAVTAVENADGEGHGPKVELVCGTPGWMLPWTPWNPKLSADALKIKDKSDNSAVFSSALDYKVQAAKFGHTAGFIAIQRDRDTGRIYLDSKDPKRRQLHIKYNPSLRDRAGILEGVIMAARVAYAADAIEIRPYLPGIQPFVRSSTADASTNDQAFRLWLQETRQTWNANPEACGFGSAHQMGTCRMSAGRESGVIDSTGKVWDTEGVYVADASTFPSASGVNPMVTTMAISEWIARGIVKDLKS